MGIFDGLFKMVPVDETGAPINAEGVEVTPAEVSELTPAEASEVAPAEVSEVAPAQSAQPELEALRAEVETLKNQLATFVNYGAATKADTPEAVFKEPEQIPSIRDLDFSRDGKF